MGIKNVNGRNVYVLEPSRATGTKTTTGKNWADLYTDLRWQVWEATQKNEATMLKLELASADQRRDYYDDKIKVLQDQRKQLQRAALKAEGGSSRSANSDLLRSSELLARSARAQQTKTVTKKVPAKFDPLTQETIPGFETVTTTTTAGGVSPEALEGARLVQKRETAKLREGTEEEAAAPVGPSLDSQIDRLDKELEVLLSERRTSGTGVDFDLQARTRRAFEADQGVIGQGGTAFGLAPRRRRTMARVDQPLAQERVAAFAEGAVQDRAQREALQEKRMDLLLRKDELSFLIEPKEGQPEGELLRNQALLQSFDDQISEIDSVLDQPPVLESALQSPEFTPRRAGELLLKDEFSRQPEPARVPRAMVTAGEMEIEQPPSEPSGGMEDLGLSPRSPDELEAARRAVEAAGEGLGPKTEGQLPAAPVAEVRAPITDRSLQAEPVPAGLGEATPLPVGQPVALDKDDAITNPDILDNPDFIPSQDLLAEAQQFFKGMTIQQGNEKAQRIRRPVKHFGGETEMVKEYLKEQIRIATPVGEELDQEAIEAVDKPQASSTRQRKDLYRARVVVEGTKLARQPKKLDRLAKTNLEKEDRPEHFVIVDKLMATNSGKSNAFDMSYNEISRAYKDNPEQRKEAHSYLVAKDILDGDINEPLA